MRRIVLVLALLLVTGCSTHPAPVYGKDAIREVAQRLNAPFASPGQDVPQLPDAYQSTDFGRFIVSYERAFGQLWLGNLEAAGLQVGWPGDLRFLGEGKGDGPTELPTTCPSSNLGQPKVGPASSSIFYCVTDRMSVPGMVHYPQGTLWVPIDVLMAQWQAAKPLPGNVPWGQQVAQAAFVYLTASWADALTRQIRAFAGGTWNVYLPVMERKDVAQLFGYCIAGAMGRAVYGDNSVIVQAAALTFPHTQTNDPLLDIANFTGALLYGYTNRSAGACVSAYWVSQDAPAE